MGDPVLSAGTFWGFKAGFFMYFFRIRVARILVLFMARCAYRGEVLGVQADVLQSCITVKFSYS